MNKMYTEPRHLQIETIEIFEKQHIVVSGYKDMVEQLERRLSNLPCAFLAAQGKYSMALTITLEFSQRLYSGPNALQLLKMDIVHTLENYGFQMTSICYDPQRQMERFIMTKPAVPAR